MEKFFNTSGPVDSAEHYSLPPLHRVDWEEVYHLIRTRRYFVLHAPRQTGKTSTLLAIMAELNAEGRFACAYANIEGAQAARGDETKGIPTVCSAIAGSIRLYLDQPEVFAWLNTTGRDQPANDLLKQMLEHWSRISAKPVVLLLDEVDALVGDTLISLLRQIRAGYAQRPAAFPQSIILCGVRDVRDYRMRQKGEEVITGGSAFNIKAESLRMGNFLEEEIRSLWRQHTEATGQTFAPEIFEELWLDTRGQPWLVNALGHETTWKDRAARDRTRPITLEDYRAARERLILSRATHLDQLADKLKEPRVRTVVEALLSTEHTELQMPNDDLQYVEDLGLITRKPLIHVSNRIYQEIIPRELTAVTQDSMPQETTWYIGPDRRLDMGKLLIAFQQFFRENSESWVERFEYKEAGPQLLLQAFLQRVLNGGGRLSREFGLGRRRTDLFLEWPLDEIQGFFGPVQRVVIELKLLHARRSLETTLAEGLEQTADYADRVGAEEAHLVVFHRDPEIVWEERIWNRRERFGERDIVLWGC
ncbi:AAA family ATPase [Desulfonatronum thioautotrophicum]|uniref:AAA family ATPase n=1 Tax=Desulfonatronum thioautotrophicum TaxID=617001 RepID=UPI0005EBBB75|nr:AAA family ATPase [Desulfonatronum thioautotrophicum]